MTKAELLKALEGFTDEDEVVIGIKGIDEWRHIDTVENAFGGLGLVSETEPNAYDLCTYAEAYYQTGAGYCDEREAFREWRALI